MLKTARTLVFAALIGAAAPAVKAGSEPVPLSDAYRLVFREGTAILSPEHHRENADALEKLAALIGQLGARRDLHVVALAPPQDEIAAQRLYAVRGALSSSYQVAFPKLESIGLTGAAPGIGQGGAQMHFALRPASVRSDACPWDLIVRHPGLAGAAGVRIAAGLEAEIHLPKGGRVLATPVSELPHALAFAYTSETSGYVLDETGAASAAELRLTVSGAPIALPQLARIEPPAGSGQPAGTDLAQRAVGNDIRAPQLVPAGPDEVICSVKLVYAE